MGKESQFRWTDELVERAIIWCLQYKELLDLDMMKQEFITNPQKKSDPMNWHVIPNNDLEPHEESTTCKCNPKVEHINGNMVIIHNAFDGREGLEWFNEINKLK